jgi:hypothetical protein
MRIGILDSGLMGGKPGTIFARAGHEVVFSYARRERLARHAAHSAFGLKSTLQPMCLHCRKSAWMAEMGQSLPKRDVRVTSVYPSILRHDLAAPRTTLRPNRRHRTRNRQFYRASHSRCLNQLQLLRGEAIALLVPSKKSVCRAGTTTSKKSGPTSIPPPPTTVARGRCTWLPIPVEIAAGSKPIQADKAVINIGRIRCEAA